MDGDEAAVEIWIDRSDKGVVHQDVVKVAESFVWDNRKITVNVFYFLGSISCTWQKVF